MFIYLLKCSTYSINIFIKTQRALNVFQFEEAITHIYLLKNRIILMFLKIEKTVNGFEFEKDIAFVYLSKYGNHSINIFMKTVILKVFTRLKWTLLLYILSEYGIYSINVHQQTKISIIFDLKRTLHLYI